MRTCGAGDIPKLQMVSGWTAFANASTNRALNKIATGIVLAAAAQVWKEWYLNMHTMCRLCDLVDYAMCVCVCVCVVEYASKMLVEFPCNLCLGA